jgi:CheY-like chemotaxis protein
MGLTKGNTMANLATVLLAEDNQDDVLLVLLAFKRAGFPNPVKIVPTGTEVVRYLKGVDEYSDRVEFPLPQLLLLDLQMPAMSGLEVLTWLRQQPETELKHLPAIVLTHSAYAKDVKEAYRLGANSFLSKPADFPEFVNTIKQMGDFWLTRVEVPGLEPPVLPPVVPRHDASAASSPSTS